MCFGRWFLAGFLDWAVPWAKYRFVSSLHHKRHPKAIGSATIASFPRYYALNRRAAHRSIGRWSGLEGEGGYWQVITALPCQKLGGGTPRRSVPRSIINMADRKEYQESLPW